MEKDWDGRTTEEKKQLTENSVHEIRHVDLESHNNYPKDLD